MKILSMKQLLFVMGGILFFTACQKDSEQEIVPPSKPSEPYPPYVMTITPESIKLAVGESFQLVAKVNGEPVQEGVRWESNCTLMDVDENGKLTILRQEEFISNLKVTASLPGGLYAICPITVYQKYHKYRLTLKDKGNADFSLNQPEKFLSAKAIERRHKRNIAIDNSDLPISKSYLKEIEKVGGTIVSQSKWLKTVCVMCDNDTLVNEYKKLFFVENVVEVWKGDKTKQIQHADPVENFSHANMLTDVSSKNYGEGWENIAFHHGQILHERGFKGKGIDIAIIDGGFKNLPNNPTLNNIRIKGAKSFIYEDDDPYNSNYKGKYPPMRNEHGIWTLACMAGNKPEYYVGTAPEASYWLLRAEDMSKENPVEEDYWVAALEYADSVGTDVVNSSVNYLNYDMPYLSHEPKEMDGNTTLPTRAANVAANKGILIVCKVRDESYREIGSPADSPNVLTVGSVTRKGHSDYWGAMTADGRMKPDVVALGESVYTVDMDGSTMLQGGSSYASTISCGLVACLWEAYPWLTNLELMDVLKKSADRHDNPELPYGHGVIDIQKAVDLIEAMR